MREQRPKTILTEGDFWDFLPSVFVKELRQGLRANVFVWPFLFIQLFAIVFVSLEYGARHWNVFDPSSAEYFFLFFNYVAFSLVLPLTQFAALQPELGNGRNVELLLISNLSRWQIVIGKWTVSFLLSLLVLISLLPYWQVRYTIGAVSDLEKNVLIIGSLILINAMANAIVIGASGYRNIVARIFMIFLSAFFGSWTLIAVNGFYFLKHSLLLSLITIPLSVALIIALSLQLGRAKLRIFENPLDPPSSALIVVLMVCTPIMIGASVGVTAMFGGADSMIMASLLLIVILLIDPGPGKKNRKWAHA